MMSLIHLSILVAYRNFCSLDEWPNFEFYPNTDFQEEPLELIVGDELRPFKLNCSILEVMELLGVED